MYKKTILLSFILSAFVSHAVSKELNYTQAKIFRLSSYDRVEEWIQPFHSYHKGTFNKYSVAVLGAMQLDVLDAKKDFASKDNSKITSRLNTSLGNPYDAYAKVSTGYRYERFFQNLAVNSGASAVVNDPVFPELELIFFQDVTAISSYLFKISKTTFIKPRISYGYRKVLDSSFTAAELVAKEADTKISNKPWKFYAEVGVLGRFKLDYFDFMYEANSLPITQNNHSYWDTNVAIKSKNLRKYIGTDLIKSSYFSLAYSPFYGGDYDVSRTVKVALDSAINENLIVSMFLEDEFSFGALVKFRSKHFEVSTFTRKSFYDDYKASSSRQYGLTFKIQL